MSLTTDTDSTTTGSKGPNLWLVLLALAFVLLLAVAGFLGLQVLNRLDAIESQIADLSSQAIEATDASERALARATRGEEVARAAAEGRLLAEADTARAEENAVAALEDADASRADAATSREEAARAREEADRIRAEAQAELDRLEKALGKIADTRRTALGLVMNLGEDTLKFDFDKADLKPEDKELLSRIAGILLTSQDYTIAISGHTDDVGSDEYNEGLSERRAAAVRDYLVEANISEEILSVQGWGKQQPLVHGTSDAARAKNRRVELGIVNIRINYPQAPRR